MPEVLVPRVKLLLADLDGLSSATQAALAECWMRLSFVLLAVQTNAPVRSGVTPGPVQVKRLPAPFAALPCCP